MECGNELNKNKEQPSETTEKRDLSSFQIGGNSEKKNLKGKKLKIIKTEKSRK